VELSFILVRYPLNLWFNGYHIKLPAATRQKRHQEASVSNGRGANHPETKENPVGMPEIKRVETRGRKKKPTTREAVQRLIIGKLVKRHTSRHTKTKEAAVKSS